MLCGYSPIRAENPKDIIAETTRGDIRFHQRYWGKISPEGAHITFSRQYGKMRSRSVDAVHKAKDFILTLLKVDPKQRPTAAEALQLPVGFGSLPPAANAADHDV
jgi:calcium/calmodulin-dependent protein kinase I